MLSEKEFNELKQLTYIQYLINRVLTLHTKASGSCFDNKTNELESIYIYLGKHIKATCVNNVTVFIETNINVKINDGWISPAFAMQFLNN